MTRVLIVDDDPRMSSALAGELVRQGYDTQTADSVDAALELLLNAPVDVLVTDLRMSGRDGLDLIRMARATSPKTRAVLMSAYATAKDYKVAIELGAVDVLTKPFTPEDLEEAIRKALDSQSGVQGLVHGLSLVDVLQMFHFARRSLAIHVGGDGATIHLRDGEVVHAVSGAITGEAALRAILESQVSSVRTSPAVSVPITITRGFQALLLDLVRAIDEQGRSLPQPPGPASTGKTPTPDLVFDLGVDERTTVDSTPRVFAPDPSEASPAVVAPVVEDANLAAALEPDPEPMVEIHEKPGRWRLWAALAAGAAMILGAWWITGPDPETKPAVEAKATPPPTPTPTPPTAAAPPPAVSKPIEISSEPTGMTIVDAESGVVLGRTPFALTVAAGEQRRIAAAVGEQRSQPRAIKAGEGPTRLELEAWVASLEARPAPTRPAASRPPPRPPRGKTKPAPEPVEPTPVAETPPPPVVEPPPPPVAERPKLPPLEPKKPALGLVDDDRPSIGTVDGDEPELAPVD